MSLLKQLFSKKSLSDAVKDAGDPHASEGSGTLKRHLNAWNLASLGVGAIIGAGIFSLTGTAAANYAGPGIVYSFIIGGILCAFAGLCYAEMAAMVPVSGSAYAYSYTTMGELLAWIIGWDLILEYAFGAVTVCISWSGYFVSLLTKTLGVTLSDDLLRFTKGPWDLVKLSDGSEINGLINIPAIAIALLVAAILYKGIKESARVNNVIVIVKVLIILAFIIMGWSVIDSANWVANADAQGFMQLIPAQFGWDGVLRGAGVVFFAYIGFDAVSTTAQETKNPKRDLPIGMLGSLVFCTIVYILMSLTMTGVVHYTQLGVSDPVAVGVDRIVELHGWSAAAKSSISFFVKLGALAGLTSVVLVMMLGQTRIFYSMSKDGLIPYFHKIHPKFGTPSTATIVTGLGVALATGFMSLNLVGELVSIGTLLAFVLVCLGVFILRFTDPLVPRPFKTPLFWFTAPAGIASSIYVMSYLPGDTWLRLMGWLCFGMAFYFFYGIKHSVLNKGKLANLSNNQTALLGGVWLVGAFLCLYQLLKHHI